MELREEELSEDEAEVLFPSPTRAVAKEGGEEEEGEAVLLLATPALPHGAPAAAPAGAGQPPTPPRQNSSLPTFSPSSRFLWGVACIVCVAAIWVGAGELAQYLFIQLSFSEPIFLTYVNVSEFALLLPLAALRERLYERVGSGGGWLASPPSDWRGAARAALMVCPLWFFAQGTYNMSLVTTSVSSSTALSSTSCVFTFLLSLCVHRRGGGWLSGAGVASTLAGALLVGVGDDSGSGSGEAGGAGGSWKGDALALTSAAAYAGYSMAIKLCVPEEASGASGGGGGGAKPPSISIAVFFGCLGVFTSLGLLPLVAALHLTGTEDLSGVLSRPQLPSIVALVLAKGLLDNVLSDLLWARAIQLTSPTLASVGLSLTIPMAVCSDLVLRGLVPRVQGGLGALLIFAGFLASVLGENPVEDGSSGGGGSGSGSSSASTELRAPPAQAAQGEA